MNAKSRHLRGEPPSRLVHREKLCHDIADSLGTIVRAAKGHLRHVPAQHASCDWMPLCMIGIEKAFWRYVLNRLSQLPSQVHCILHTDVQALSAHRRVHVRSV